MESVHYLKKMVAGAPNIRPPWFFDTTEQGEGLNDVGTHLVDLVQWTLFPEQAIDYRPDIQVLAAQQLGDQRFENRISHASRTRPGFRRVLAQVMDGRFDYFCNTLVSYTLRGVHTTLNVIWDWEPAPGSAIRTTRSTGGRAPGSRFGRRGRQAASRALRRPEPSAETQRQVLAAVRTASRRLQQDFAGVAVEERGGEFTSPSPTRSALVTKRTSPK